MGDLWNPHLRRLFSTYRETLVEVTYGSVVDVKQPSKFEHPL